MLIRFSVGNYGSFRDAQELSMTPGAILETKAKILEQGEKMFAGVQLVNNQGQIVNQETARALLPFGKYINREQDLGIEGLRHAKSSYAPVELLRNWNLIPKAGV